MSFLWPRWCYFVFVVLMCLFLYLVVGMPGGWRLVVVVGWPSLICLDEGGEWETRLRGKGGGTLLWEKLRRLALNPTAHRTRWWWWRWKRRGHLRGNVCLGWDAVIVGERGCILGLLGSLLLLWLLPASKETHDRTANSDWDRFRGSPLVRMERLVQLFCWRGSTWRAGVTPGEHGWESRPWWTSSKWPSSAESRRWARFVAFAWTEYVVNCCITTGSCPHEWWHLSSRGGRRRGSRHRAKWGLWTTSTTGRNRLTHTTAQNIITRWRRP